MEEKHELTVLSMEHDYKALARQVLDEICTDIQTRAIAQPNSEGGRLYEDLWIELKSDFTKKIDAHKPESFVRLQDVITKTLKMARELADQMEGYKQPEGYLEHRLLKELDALETLGFNTGKEG